MNLPIGIVNYGMGNLLSVKNAIEYLGGEAIICDDPAQMEGIGKFILPGVGAFRDCADALKKRGFISFLNRVVTLEKKPILGICLGMQVMAKKSYENGEFEGLGWFDAEVKSIKTIAPHISVPQIGWNEIKLNRNHPIWEGLPINPEVYFVHSYFVQLADPKDCIAEVQYGQQLPAAIAKENIVAVQFHPERSQDIGLKILENFLNWEGQIHA